MSRSLRSQRILGGQPNHIVCRGNNRRRLFSYPIDYQTYLRLLAKHARRFDCEVHALCLMANHVHLLVTPPSVQAASDMMKYANQRYAQIRNEKRGGSGKLFEQSFFSEPIITDRHLAYCVLYIDANPHAAGLPTRTTYPWSTHALHRGKPQAGRVWSSLITLDPWYLSLGRDQSERHSQFEDHFRSYLGGELGDEIRSEERQLEPPQKCRRRLLRPNGTSAAEAFLRFRREPE